MKDLNKKIHIFAIAACGQGISGSDRIFIEFARRWSKDFPVTIYVWEEGYQMCQRQKLSVSGIKYRVSRMEPWKKFGFVINYLARIIEGIRLGLTTKIENSKDTIVYSASEFWMDCLPAFLLKLRFHEIKWAAAWYQTAPNPLKGFSGSLPYWLMQFPVKPLIAKFTDYVLVNNEEEKKQFPKHAKNQKAVVVLGAVDIKKIEKWKLKFRKLPKIYDGVFQGRFHPQKGVEELVNIWKRVVDKKPDARLVMIGDGPLMESVKSKMQSAKLEKNVILTGYLFDGEEKYRIFAQSKIVVHPAFYDSGGMASAEAMAFGLPAVGFDLKAYQSYYPEGMEKVKEGNLEAFANRILDLLHKKNLYWKVSKEALHWIDYKWSWEFRSRQILKVVLE